jgi:NAD(P)-dependent dehydrogenase (short-subunit alcohol dehydrogenase family)
MLTTLLLFISACVMALMLTRKRWFFSRFVCDVLWTTTLKLRPAIAHDTAQLDIRGKVVLVTGTTNGIGLELARRLSSLGCRLVLAVRRVEHARKLAEAYPTKVLDVLHVDLADMASVVALTREYVRRGLPPIDVVILNAGLAYGLGPTKQGLESIFAVNYLANFVLVNGLLRAGAFPFEPAADGFVPRVIAVSSECHRAVDPDLPITADLASPHPVSSLGSFMDYSTSKALLNTWACELQRRLGRRAWCVAICPGGVRSNIGAEDYPVVVQKVGGALLRLIGRTPAEAQEFITRVARMPGTAGSFAYFSQLRQEAPALPNLDEDRGKAVWKISEELLARSGGDL